MTDKKKAVATVPAPAKSDAASKLERKIIIAGNSKVWRGMWSASKRKKAEKEGAQAGAAKGKATAQQAEEPTIDIVQTIVPMPKRLKEELKDVVVGNMTTFLLMAALEQLKRTRAGETVVLDSEELEEFYQSDEKPAA